MYGWNSNSFAQLPALAQQLLHPRDLSPRLLRLLVLPRPKERNLLGSSVLRTNTNDLAPGASLNDHSVKSSSLPSLTNHSPEL